MKLYQLCILAVVGIISVNAAGSTEPAPEASGSAAAAAAAPAYTGPPKTIVLTSQDFDDKVSYWAEDEWVVEFYAEWCHHCKQFAPTYDKIALALEPAGVKVAKIDCAKHRDVCTRFGISGFPTIKLIRGKHVPADKALAAAADPDAGRRVYDFTGERTVEALVSFATTKSVWSAATSDIFPKPGEALDGGATITKMIAKHPALAGFVFLLVVVLLIFFIWVMIDSMKEDAAEDKDRAAVAADAAAAKDKTKKAILTAAADGGSDDASAASDATPESNGNGNGAASPKPRRTQRAE